MATYGDGRLALPPGHPGFAQFLFWFHYANGTLQAGDGPLHDPEPAQAGRGRSGAARSGGAARPRASTWSSAHRAAPLLAGDDFTAADIMMGFSLTTMRYFLPYDLVAPPDMLAYLSRIGARARPTGARWRRAIRAWRCC